ncbi:citrate/2-methylcitrate synthase [Pectobacterium sp. A5351]|uniref:citrate/2-methylcitrate synthase n=1 Tax=Pectobacterium sp. A5351 TaxID=2914983 RepID=UPI00232CC9D6|nr:citrate/2-methylcitrate synthase [Pectobacterium sp. A5351]WCG82803.1 citrate/2-methylcitrate synthase [Pectobacterium sp. A5351]
MSGSFGVNTFACMRLLEEIQTVNRVPEFVQRAKGGCDSFLLMRFGNSVYQHFDPHAAILRKICYEVLNELGREDSLLLVAMEPPPSMFTVISTAGRMVGWIAHGDEMHKQEDINIYRARQIYTVQPSGLCFPKIVFL